MTRALRHYGEEQFGLTLAAKAKAGLAISAIVKLRSRISGARNVFQKPCRSAREIREQNQRGCISITTATKTVVNETARAYIDDAFRPKGEAPRLR